MTLHFPPGPRPRFFGLNIVRALFRDPLAYNEQVKREHGGAVYVPLGRQHQYLFSDPELVRSVLVENAKTFIRWEHQAAIFRPTHGDSILMSEGEAWQRQRRMLQPEFNPRRFTGYARQVTDAAQRALNKMLAGGDTTVDFGHEMNMLTMDAILRTMFSVSSDAETVEVEKALSDLGLLSFKEIFIPFALPGWLPLPGVRLRNKHIAYLERLIYRTIDARRADPAPRQDLLDMLLNASDAEAAGAKLSDKEVRDQCMTMFLAGHETTAVGLTWTGWCLASHPDVLQRVLVEIDTVLGGRSPTYDDMPRLSYLGQVVKESMRLYPPAPALLVRRAAADAQVGSWTVPKGSLVVIYPYLLHRDERWFPDPLRFDPERFSEERAKTLPRGVYFPFGTGPRVCIGSSFAVMEMTLVMAMLLQRCTLEPALGQREPDLQLTVVMRPKGELRLTLRKRDARRANSAPAATLAAGCPFHAAARDLGGQRSDGGGPPTS